MKHIYFYELYEIGNKSDFWSGFLSNLLSGLLLTILASWLIPKYLDWIKRPKLQLLNRKTRSKVFSLAQSQDGHWESVLSMTMKNEGNSLINHTYWHLLIPNGLIHSAPGEYTKLDEFPIDREPIGDEWQHWYGDINKPIFPGRSFMFPYRLIVNVQEKKQYKIYYYFSTEFGTFPSKARYIDDDYNKIANKDYLEEIIIN